MAAYRTIADISMSYAGRWHGLVGSLQPALVDAGFRGGSEERWLLQDGIVAQAHTGPDGHKQVVRQTMPGSQGKVQVWFNGVVSDDGDKRAAAALVADGYSLFLLGPMLLARQWATDRSLVMQVGSPELVRVEGRSVECDVLRVAMTPGLGFSSSDQLALYIGRDDRLMHRVRFTLNGLESTRGAVAEVDTGDHVLLHGIHWPTRFHERLLRPLPLAVHDWRLTGLDVNRGLRPGDVTGPDFIGGASHAAGALS